MRYEVRGGLVSRVLGCVEADWGAIPGIFIFANTVWSVTCPMDTGGKADEREAGHSRASVGAIYSAWNVISTPL